MLKLLNTADIHKTRLLPGVTVSSLSMNTNTRLNFYPECTLSTFQVKMGKEMKVGSV